MAFKKVERSYHSTPNGYRLATFEEARNGLEMIKEKNILSKWDRARLLDGWITGPGYDFEMGNDFKGCLGYMLLIQTEASGGTYANVILSDRGKEVALFLCVDDWNYEVVYWLLNSWSNSQTMNVGEVREGKIQFSNAMIFKKMNEMMSFVARRLGEEGGKALEKAGKPEYSGKVSVKEVLSGMNKILTEDNDIMEFMSRVMWMFTGYEGQEYFLPNSVKKGDVAEAFWNFVCDSFAGYVVEVCALPSLRDLCKMEAESTSQSNLKIASFILLHLSDFRTDIIHEPLAHDCKGSCAEKILRRVAKMAAGNSQKFNEMLKNNAMWRCYDDMGNYGVLDKLLIIVAKAKYNYIKQGEKITVAVVDMLLQCGAQPGRCHAIGKYKNKTALHSVAKFPDENVGIEVAQALLSRCDEQIIYGLVNAADERGRTALHSASEKGNARICELLVDRGASVTAQDKKGMTALHYALEGRIGIGIATEVAQALLSKGHKKSISEFVNAADERGRTALHSASENGNARICGLLVDSGALVIAQDKKGMTALHHTLEGRIGIDVATEVAQALLGRCHEQSIHKFVNAADEGGRTALHSTSEKGNAFICGLLVDRDASMTAQDRKGMTALHYALEGRIDDVINELVKSPHVTKSLDLKDHRGNTPLDIAVANGNYKLVEEMLSKSEDPEACFNKVDAAQILCNSLQLGHVRIVDRLFKKGIRLPAGDCDQEGKTVLHLAAMCDNESNAIEIISLLIGGLKTPDLENMVAKRDKKGRTALHEAALNGHAMLCEGLLDMNPELIYIKDRDGRNPLYEVVEREYKDRKSLYVADNEDYNLSLSKKLLDAYLKKDVTEDDLTDRCGRTLLHIAASQGKSEFVEQLLSSHEIKTKHLSRADIRSQTALHMAVKHGEKDIVKILLDNGAHPLRERDCDGRTALHYAVQAEKGNKVELAEMLLRRCERREEKSLLLWASAAGVGTADQDINKDDALHNFLLSEKERLKEDKSFRDMYKGNLLKMAASLGQIEMTKELISRGYQIGDIRDPEWKDQERVKEVIKKIETIKEQGNDKPAISDSLGRLDYAQGLAALFLNPYIKPPIAVGITGDWGMGKSSLMLQTERILLTTAAQMALLPSSKLSSLELELPDIRACELSTKAKRKCEHIYRQIKCGERINKNTFVILWDKIRWKLKHTRVEDIQKELEKFLYEYNLKNLNVFKALAAMDSSDMLKTNASRPKADPSAEENVPAVLTVRYNAWKYRDDTEALAGIAVEISKELEGIMTQAQWLNTCWRNAMKKKKYTLWIEIFFPSLLAMVLVGSFSWIVWVVLDSDKLKGWVKAKYAWPPAAVAIIVWTVTKSIMGIVKPVSAQLKQYISFPDHTDKLGYQERVISDIIFLEDEIGKKAYWVFIVFSWIFNVFSWVLTIIRVLCGLITGWYIISLLFHLGSHEKAIEAPNVTPASGSNLRIIVFVDDLDRCQESVILKVLSAVNLVLAECKISVVIGMDKRLIERAIIKKFKDVNAIDNKKLADMYLQKIIQLPVDLPDPSDEESSRFLKGQLGVSENENKTSIEDNRSSTNGGEETETVQQNTAAPHCAVNVDTPSETVDTGHINFRERCGQTGVPSQKDGDGTITRKEKPVSYTLLREMLFVRYSKGEEDAFLYFQGLATDYRKHPREWKRLLNYHRLVWYIFSVNEKAKTFYGWQVELITWIFICREWQECMNLVIKKWKEGDLKMNASSSLLMIVEHLMEERERENMKATGHEENGEGKIVTIPKPEDTSEITDDLQNSENASAKSLGNAMEQKLDALEKSLVELKKEMKQFKEVISDMLKKDIKEFKEQLSDELKKIKEQMVGKESGQSKASWETEKKIWETMKSTLEKYDVSMKGIRAFQRFRFNCIAGYLPRLGKDSENGSV